MDLISSLNRPFTERGLFSEALLYVDNGAAEAIHANVGLKGLADIGTPLALKLQDAQSCDTELYSFLAGKKPRILVILVTQILEDLHSPILRAIEAHSELTNCLILSSVSEEAHGSSLGGDAYLVYEQALKEDLTEMFAKSEGARELPYIDVQYFPLQACALTSTAFVLPAGSAAASKSWAAARLTSEPPIQGQQISLGKDEKAGMKILAHALVGLAATLDCSLETFSLGAAARACGEELCSREAPEDPHSQAPHRSAAIVLLDRQLDMRTPSQHSSHIVDRMFGLLPRPDTATATASSSSLRRPHIRSLEIAVPCGRDGSNLAQPMTALPTRNAAIPPTTSIFPATSPNAGSTDSGIAPWLQLLLVRRDSDAALFIRKWLKEAIRKAGLQPPRSRFKPGTVTSAELGELVEVLRASTATKVGHRGLLDIANAAVTALACEDAKRWDALAKLEEQLTILSTEGSEGLVIELEDLFKTAKGNGLLKVKDALQLAIEAFSLAADQVQRTGLGMSASNQVFSASLMNQLRGGLIDAILNADIEESDAWLGGLCARLRGAQEAVQPEASPEKFRDKALRLEVEDKVDDLLAKLNAVSRQRMMCSPQLTMSPAERDNGQRSISLISSLTTAIAGRQNIPGLQHHSASLRNMLNSGLGRFGLKQKVSMPHEHERVILFFIGGISIADIRAMNQALESSQSDSARNMTILCGGTSLLSPSDTLHQFF